MKKRIYEYMRRFESGPYVVRFWVDSFRASGADCNDRLDAIVSAHAPVLKGTRGEGSVELADAAAHAMVEHWDAINAVEVIVANTGDGTVAYRDWP